MSILEGMELNWVQYQINHGIEMRYNSNSIVWMSLYWSTSMETTQFIFMFGCTSMELVFVPIFHLAEEHYSGNSRCRRGTQESGGAPLGFTCPS